MVIVSSIYIGASTVFVVAFLWFTCQWATALVSVQATTGWHALFFLNL